MYHKLSIQYTQLLVNNRQLTSTPLQSFRKGYSFRSFQTLMLFINTSFLRWAKVLSISNLIFVKSVDLLLNITTNSFLCASIVASVSPSEIDGSATLVSFLLRFLPGLLFGISTPSSKYFLFSLLAALLLKFRTRCSIFFAQICYKRIY